MNSNFGSKVESVEASQLAPEVVRSGWSSITTSVITDEVAFAELAEEWDRLVEECGSSTPFQAHAWLSSWWRAYGTAGRLRVVLIYSGDRLMAGAALYLRRRLPVRVLSPVGAGVSDFSDILVADELGDDRVSVILALGDVLRRLRGWDVIELPEVRPGAAAFDLGSVWPARISQTPASLCIEFEAESMDNILSRLSASTRRNRRQALRKIERAGVTTNVVTAADVPEALEHFHRLHRAQWEGRGINPEHTRARFRALLAEAIPPMVARNQAVITQYRLGAELMAVVIYVANSSLLGGYLTGVSPQLRKHIDVSMLLNRDGLTLAREREIHTFSLLRGEEETKLRWKTVTASPRNMHVLFGRPHNLRTHAYSAVTAGRSHTRWWLRAHTPWLRKLPVFVRRMRSRLPSVEH